MIKKPEGYDESWAATGEPRSLPAGCYVCVIKQASVIDEYGKEKLAILFDIAEGEQKDFYKSQYDAARASSSEAKWKGVHKQIMSGTGLPYFKGLITSIEKSNPGFVFKFGVDGNEKTLAGKKFGLVMGREQFKANDGNLKWATKVFQVRSLEGLKNAEIPEDKPYTETEPQAGAPSSSGSIPFVGTPDKDGFMNIPDGIDEQLPFN